VVSAVSGGAVEQFNGLLRGVQSKVKKIVQESACKDELLNNSIPSRIAHVFNTFDWRTADVATRRLDVSAFAFVDVVVVCRQRANDLHGSTALRRCDDNAAASRLLRGGSS
jgi:hypothetical protein